MSEVTYLENISLWGLDLGMKAVADPRGEGGSGKL